MLRLFTTNHQRDWWCKRKINWKTAYLDTYNHPHRLYLIEALKDLLFASVFEIGCGPGANLVPIHLAFPYVAVGGVDVNPEAIALAQQTLPPGSLFDVASAESIMMSDKSTDIGLSDMTLIYVGPLKIIPYLKELVRISRRHIVLVEFYHPSFWKRVQMTLAGRYTHNYPRLLRRLGCSDIVVRKMPEGLWPGAKDNAYRHIIIART